MTAEPSPQARQTRRAARDLARLQGVMTSQNDSAKTTVLKAAAQSGWTLRHDFIDSVEMYRGRDDLFVQFTRHGLQVSSAVCYGHSGVGAALRIAPRSADKRARLLAYLGAPK